MWSWDNSRYSLHTVQIMDNDNESPTQTNLKRGFWLPLAEGTSVIFQHKTAQREGFITIKRPFYVRVNEKNFKTK